ncbi:O-antigen polymerase [Williamsia sp. 1138]|uniref:O-antigen polymerase n=1 Tax=Williamsia sp. 1138 TaxID=1903117 RepID=UPI00117FB078|nr:O-antigen polymerase [Williamsia sp. 1138]
MVATIALFNTLIGVCAIVIATKGRVGYLISPFSVSMALLIAIFGIRPLLISSDQDHLFYGYSVASGYLSAVLVGGVAILSLTLGYWLISTSGVHSEKVSAANGHNPAQARSSDPLQPDDVMTRIGQLSASTMAIICVALVMSWVSLMVVAGGGPGVLTEMAGGRSDATALATENLPLIVYSLPAAAAYVACFWRVAVERIDSNLSGGSKLIFWAVILASLAPPALLGNRRFILPCVIAAVIASNLPLSKWTARVSAVKIVLSIVVVTVLAAIPYVRSAGSRQAGDNLLSALSGYINTEGFGGVFTNFFRSYDTEMYDYIALISPKLGGAVPYGLGRGAFVDIGVAALPAGTVQIPSWSNQLLVENFGQTCASGICPVPSFAGTAYFDFGYLGVAVFGIALGIASRKFENIVHNYRGLAFLAILIAGSLPATAVRGNFPSQIWIGLNIFVLAAAVVCAVALVCRPQEKKRLGRVSASPLVGGRTSS